MKVPQILLTAVLASVFVGVFVGQPSATKADDSASKHQLCESLETLARTIMTRRQEGLSLSLAMKAIENVDATQEMSEFVRSTLIAAYHTPRFSVPSNQQEAIEDFANEIALQCYLIYD